MNKKVCHFFRFLFFLGSIGFVYGQSFPNEIKEDHLIDRMFEHQDFCVSGFDGNRIFIRLENIVYTRRGAFINLNDFQFFPIPILQLSNRGYFIEAMIQYEPELVYENSQGRCLNCESDTNGKGICLNVKCFFYRLKVI